ncbi:hydroxymethylbilane synthase [Hathewaya limosa]|uniref:Porphobilinogen deaminase n=1 Tax=Hathewaya limosa TaxID=1536 RepID=A0ABU0JV48_HATLI|nr:hydroxymethylbilane synthase [Hathewaya limosa]AWZ49573.1 hydroxymethylbilane synthase [Clostridiaceae bacterium 14S0207]MDQ0480979.1 hydroxymethylbilane synthase [Hathewaya limosa]
MKIVVGSRGSKLALTQTNWVIDQLKKGNPEVEFEVKIIKTKGDRIQHIALDKIGDKGLFVKEIEEQLLNGDIDMAVHSMKDMPSVLPEGLKFSYIPKREDIRDVIVLKEGYNSLEDLPKGAVIGSGSKRRKYQLLQYRKDLNIVPIRGNVDTRIKKIETENLDGVILAAAGLNRLGLTETLKYKVCSISTDILLPAPAQGALALEIREDRNDIHEVIKSLSHKETEIAVEGERAFLDGINGSCHIPVGAKGIIEGNKFILIGLLGSEDGDKIIRKTIEGTIDKAKELGYELAKLILKEIN